MANKQNFPSMDINKWILVTSAIQSIRLFRRDTSVNYYFTFTDDATPPPDDRDEGDSMFLDQEPNYDAFGFDTLVYFWVWVDSASERGDIRVTTGVSLGGSVVGTKENPSNVKRIESEKPAVEPFMWEEIQDVTLVASLSRFDDVATFEPGHGFLNPSGFDKDYFNIHYVDFSLPGFIGNRFSQHAVISVVGDVVEFTPPLGYDVDLSKIEFMKRVNVNMAAVGTHANKIKFVAYPPDGQIWGIRGFLPEMIMSTKPDDSLFGNIAALENGLFLGFENADYAEYGIPGSIFDNGDFAATAYDIRYNDRVAGIGNFGLNVRKTISSDEKSGVVMKLYGTTNDLFAGYIQDDISGIARFRIKIRGSVE